MSDKVIINLKKQEEETFKLEDAPCGEPLVIVDNKGCFLGREVLITSCPLGISKRIFCSIPYGTWADLGTIPYANTIVRRLRKGETVTFTGE